MATSKPEPTNADADALTDQTPDFTDMVAADAARAAAVASGLLAKVYEGGEARGETNIRVESLMVIAILNWTHEDGTEREDTIIGAETKRRYVQLGILRSALGRFDDDDRTGSDWDDDE